MIYYQPNAFSNSYNFASVTEAEESRRKMRDKILAVTNHHKPSETFHNSLTRKSPKNAGSAEAYPCYFNVGTIVFHIFIAELRNRPAMRIAEDINLFNGGVINYACYVRLDRFPNFQKTSVAEPQIRHSSIWFGREAEIVPPINQSVAFFEEQRKTVSLIYYRI